MPSMINTSGGSEGRTSCSTHFFWDGTAATQKVHLGEVIRLSAAMLLPGHQDLQDYQITLALDLYDAFSMSAVTQNGCTFVHKLSLWRCKVCAQPFIVTM